MDAIWGSSDLDQEEGLSAKCKAWMISMMISGMFRKSRLPDADVTCLDYSPDKEAAYGEVFRVLKPGGIRRMV